jgi:HPt (histidine-containing phosphotransfer) domain-containing protein
MHQAFKLIDLSYLNSIADGNQDIIKELIDIFIDQLPEFTIGFHDCFKAADWARLAALAHKAKSSVMSMGMNDLGNVDLKNLELLAKNRRIKDLHQIISRTEKEDKELDMLIKNLQSYTDDRQKWLDKNDHDDMIVQIIDKFVSACEIAKAELRSVIEA